MRFSLVWILLLSATHALAEIEPWTRESDQVTINAELLGFDPASDDVRLKLENGTEANIKGAILIQDHRDRLAKLAEALAANVEASKKPRLESFTPEGGGDHKIHVYKPAGYIDGDPSSRERPVAFLYSAGGKSTSVLNRLKPAADELGWVLIGVDAYKNSKSLEDTYDERFANTKVAFEWAKKNVDFSRQKIVFGGMSGGGWWSYQSAAELTTEAAGILAFGGWMGNMYDKKYSRNMAVAMINGDKDKNAISYEEKDGDFLRKRASADIEIFHFPGGHVLAPADVALNAARWIHETKEFAKVGE